MTPTPPLSPSPHSSSFTNASDTSGPLTCLDALLEIYLDRLDTYQKLREQLSESLSAGFLSLANANRTSNLGSGRLYGAEGYDERMKARRRVKLRPPGQEHSSQAPGKGAGDGVEPGAHSRSNKILYTIEQHKLPELDSGDLQCAPVPKETLAQISANSSASPPSIPGPKAPNPLTASSISLEVDVAPSLASPLVEKPTTPTKQNARTYPDPLNWYGLLVPPSLRAAQASFTSVVDNQIPLLLNTQAEMAKLEAQIRALRREAGLSHQDFRETDDSMAGTPSTDDAKGEEEGVQPSPTNDAASDQMGNGKDEDRRSQRKTKTSGSGRERKSLSSRPKEPPRSRVLKLE
jgi:coiled-coil domain-containing protein 115